MQRLEVIEQLKNYIAISILDGKDVGLDENTPLLEWGIINSLEIVRLLSFIQKEFQVSVPVEMVVADHFASVTAITDMLLQLAARR